MKKNRMFWCVTYPILGYAIAVWFWISLALGLLQLQGWRNFPRRPRKVILVSNHPSLLEPVFLFGLFAPWYALRSHTYAPYAMADKKNFFEKWWSPLIVPQLIAVDRDNGKKGGVRSLLAAAKLLASGMNIIIFPEGTRTYKAILNGSRSSEKGKQIGYFKEGLGLLATQPDVLVVPVWFERGLPLKVTIGVPLQFSSEERDQVNTRVEDALLRLADETE